MVPAKRRDRPENKFRHRPGDAIGPARLTFVRRAGPIGETQPTGLFRCVCGREWQTRVDSVVSGATRSCGCSRVGATVRHTWPASIPTPRMFRTFIAMMVDGSTFGEIAIEIGVAHSTIGRWARRYLGEAVPA